MGRAFRQVEQVVAPSGGSATFILRNTALALNGLTIWASSGGRAMTDLTLQPQINGVDFGADTNFTAAVASGVIYAGGLDENILPNNVANATTGIDPFVVTVDVTSAVEVTPNLRTVTIYAVGQESDF